MLKGMLFNFSAIKGEDIRTGGESVMIIMGKY
jgi:hypothetical protein